MGNAFLAFLIAIGIAAWIFSKMMRRTGGITQNALIVSAVAGVFIFIITLFIANAVL